MRAAFTGALLFLATATTASAQVTFSSTSGAPDQGFAPQQLLVNFNGGPYNGVSFSGDYSILPGSVSGAAAPAGVNSGFFAVPNVNGDANGSAIIDFQGFLATQSITSLSFYWGSIDTYNKLEVLDQNLNVINFTGGANAGFLTGEDVATNANGNQTISDTNRRLFLDFTNAGNFRALRLTSNGRAFEIDDIAVAVPEPGSLALLGAGMMGLVGVARKRRG
ncbi:PEP-CTERM sorting domain-containing protein [Gemmatimonas sp. UBA7669]|uniref:PEP-CTERM sorting domain-containing protein n=1 Tax=Gemmatimonas sp. UBA7669 TaxID=1946568 RepID=UPI0025B883C7|nr:PEP-CTERM sorting domain-containing protein [Gemmatimonas sp. UBA7669]